jgi:hypothetical protein
MPKLWIGGFALLVSTLALGSWAQQAQADHVPIELVVEEGDQAPGMAAGITFYILGVPTINAVGEIAFFATITDETLSFIDKTVWAGPPDDLRLVARVGAVSPEPGAADAAPQTETGTTFVNFGLETAPVLASTGRLAFDASLSSPGTEAVYVYDIGSGQLDELIREGTEPPGLTGVTFSDIGVWVYNDAGIAVYATLVGMGITYAYNDVGIWTGTPAGLTELLRRQDESPYFGVPHYVSGFSSLVPGKNLSMNPSGQAAFLTTDYSYDIFTHVPIIYAGGPGSLAAIASYGFASTASSRPRANSPIPDCVFYNSVQNANATPRLIGASGTVAFYSTLECTSDFRYGLFLGGPAGIQTIATKTEIVDFGATWSSFWEYPVGGGDMLAVGGKLTGGSVTSGVDDRVVYGGTAGSLELFAREGTNAPDTTDDFDILDPPQVDASGRIVISGVLAGGERGIWAGTPGDVHLVAIGGGTYGSGSGSRTLTDGPDSFYNLAPFGTGNADGTPSAVSDNGQIVFRSEVDGGGTADYDGIFLYLPEPSGWPPLLAGACCLTALARVQRRRQQRRH